MSPFFTLSENYDYRESVGRILPSKLKQAFEGIGFGVKVNPIHGTGVDLKLYGNENRIVLVSEILNWGPNTRLSQERKNCIIKNLTKYPCKKLLIYTVMANEEILSDLPDHNISTLKIGYQILTRKWYNFCVETEQTLNARRIYDRKVKQEIKIKVLKYLEDSGLHPLFTT